MAVAAGAVVDHSDDAIDAFGDGVGDPGIDERHDRLLMPAQGVDELASRRLSKALFVQCLTKRSAAQVAL